jgi:hypothetical protein
MSGARSVRSLIPGGYSPASELSQQPRTTDSSASGWLEAAERYRRSADHVRELIAQSDVIAFLKSPKRQPRASRLRIAAV